MNIILATRNPSKAKQIAAVFAGSNIEILTLDEAGIEGEAVEDGVTLQENALKKVRFAYERVASPIWIMADDTGIFIDALGGEPGVQAAYWGGPELTTEERMHYCLKRMEGVEDRGAAFRTCVALISPEGEEYFFTGEVRGEILRNPQGTQQPKMPYSTLFVPGGTAEALTWAQMSTQEENAISHRGVALRKALVFLQSK